MRSRLCSSRSAMLVLSALAVVLAVTAGVLWLTGRDAGEMKIPGQPLSDAQAAGQVLASAKQIVKTAQLQDVTGGSAFVSCKNENEPPYQVAIYLNFRLLHGNPVKYLREVGASLVADGWTPAASTDEHFGQKLTRDGVTAIFYRNVNDANFATMRLYGECRNNADHRNDNLVWREVTDQLG